MRQEAIYARQSLDKKDSVSIETQIEKCKKLCETENPLEYSDKGFSGKNTDRPDLQMLIKEIEKNKISKVIVYKLDRISRNITDFYKLYEIMKKHNCEFLSVKDKFDTETSTGRAMMGILVVFAQMERENTQLRVKDNYYHRIKDGRWAGGPAPYGYENARTDKNIPTLKPIDEEIKAVKLAFKTYADSPNTSLSKVGKILNEHGYKSRKRDAFDNITIARILQNPIYAVADKKLYKYYQIQKIQFINDEESWNGTTSASIVGKKPNNVNVRKYTNMKEQSIYLTNIKGIIDSRTFIRVQNRLKENQQITSANKPSVLKELAGKLKCKECGYALKSYSKSTNGMPYISCYGARTLKACDVTFKGLKFDELRNVIGNEIQKQLNELKKIQEDKHKANDEIYDKINSLNEEVENLLNIMSKSKKLDDRILKMVEDKQTEINELELKIDLDVDFMDNIEIYTNSKTTIKMSIDEIDYFDLDDELKKAILNVLIDKIYIDKDNNIEIIWNI